VKNPQRRSERGSDEGELFDNIGMLSILVSAHKTGFPVHSIGFLGRYLLGVENYLYTLFESHLKHLQPVQMLRGASPHGVWN